MSGQGPILVFGMPRSGTTWLGKIFDSHPDTLYRHEPDSVHRITDLPLFPDSRPSQAQKDLVADYIRRVYRMNDDKVCAKLPLFSKSYRSRLESVALKGGVLLAKAAGEARIPMKVPFAALGAHRQRVRLVWKSIESLGRLGLLLNIEQQASAIHLLRHPCGVIASVLRGEKAGRFTSSTATSEDWGYFELLLQTQPAKSRGLQLSDLREMSAEERMAWSWLIINEKAMRDMQPSQRAYTVLYEELCRDPVRQVAKAMEFCNLPGHSQVEEFVTTSITHEDSGYYSVFKNPASSADKWQTELDSTVIDRILAVVADSEPGRLYSER